MNANDKDDMLFTPLTTRHASVSLSELQQYVASKPHPASHNPLYAAVATVIICVGVGLFFLLGDRAPERTVVEAPSKKQIVPQSSSHQAVISADPAATTVRELNRKQRTGSVRKGMTRTENLVPLERDLGLTEKPLLPDPNIGLSQQFILESNDPSFLVALAKIEYPDLQELHTN